MKRSSLKWSPSVKPRGSEEIDPEIDVDYKNIKELFSEAKDVVNQNKQFMDFQKTNSKILYDFSQQRKQIEVLKAQLFYVQDLNSEKYFSEQLGIEGVALASKTISCDPREHKNEILKQIENVNQKLEEEMNLTKIHQHIYDRTNKELWSVKEKLNEVEMVFHNFESTTEKWMDIKYMSEMEQSIIERMIQSTNEKLKFSRFNQKELIKSK